MNLTNTTNISQWCCLTLLESERIRYVTVAIILLIGTISVPCNFTIVMAIKKFPIIQIPQNISIIVLALWDMVIGTVLIPIYAAILLRAPNYALLGTIAHVLNRVFFTGSILTRITGSFIYIYYIVQGRVLSYRIVLFGLLGFYSIPLIVTLVLHATTTAGMLDLSANIFFIVCLSTTLMGYLLVTMVHSMKKSGLQVSKQKSHIMTSFVVFLTFFVMAVPSVIYICISSSSDGLCVGQLVILLSTIACSPIIHWIRNPLIRRCSLSLVKDMFVLRNHLNTLNTTNSSNTGIFTIDSETVHQVDRITAKGIVIEKITERER